MSADKAAQDAWVERVLGVAPESAHTASPSAESALADLRARWDAAAVSVGRQLAALADALRGTNNPSLRAIADGELDRITGGLDSALTSALKDYATGSAHAPGAAAKALDICRALRRRIATEPRVAACDRNPFGAPVAIRATLDPALADVETALSRR